MAILGRLNELKKMDHLCDSHKSEFLAIYGRRRVGKTFLIREYFHNTFTFTHTGLATADTEQQLVNFHSSLLRQCEYYDKIVHPPTWLAAFQHLITHIDHITRDGKKVIFLDELPWLDTPKSDFMIAIEHFWNSYLSARDDIILIACGSAASWMINELINNTAGLYNRVTARIKLEPFTLFETEQLLASQDVVLDRYQILLLYMVMGGIPFYIDKVLKGKSAMQVIEELAFRKNGLLRSEYTNLLRSLFRKAENHEKILEALSSNSKGLTRKEIVEKSRISSGGTLTRFLQELDESGFIETYTPFSNKKKETLYRLSDFYCLFYHRFIKDSANTAPGAWTTMIDNPSYRAWTGYAFEQICLDHLPQIKTALGISGIHSSASSWTSRDSTPGAQIDLIIDRRDQTITICEAKFSTDEYVISKSYADNLRNKVGTFRRETHTKKAVLLAMITTFGVKTNAHSGSVMQNSITMDDLFEPL